MNHYLKTTETYFIDPHGSWDDGGTTKEIISTEINYRTGIALYDDHNCFTEEEYAALSDDEKDAEDGFDSEEYYSGSEDGYNMEVSPVYFKKLTEEQAVEYREIIDKYNKL